MSSLEDDWTEAAARAFNWDEPRAAHVGDRWRSGSAEIEIVSMTAAPGGEVWIHYDTVVAGRASDGVEIEGSSAIRDATLAEFWTKVAPRDKAKLPKILTPKEKQATLAKTLDEDQDRAVRTLMNRAATAIANADTLRITVSLEPGRGRPFPPSALEIVRRRLAEAGWHAGMGPELSEPHAVTVAMILTPAKGGVKERHNMPKAWAKVQGTQTDWQRLRRLVKEALGDEENRTNYRQLTRIDTALGHMEKEA